MSKRLLLILLLVLSVTSSKKVHAQYVADKLAIHLSNPIGLFTKMGFKVEYRLYERNGILGCYDRYWGFFPGYKVGLEYHRYYQSWGRFENFLYAKAGAGFAEYRPLNIYSGWDVEYNQPGKYLFGGVGVGRRYHWGPFFIELNLGLKAAQLIDKTENYNRNLFYTLGPGSLVDCNFHFGLQFLGHRGSVSHITGTQRYRRYRY